MDDLIERCKELDKRRESFESYDLQFTKDLDLPSLTNEDLNNLLDIVPASGTRFRIIREMQRRGI